MITSQKIYAILRKAGWRGRNSSSRWPVVSRDSDTYRIWYTITYQSYEGTRNLPLDQRQYATREMAKALSAAGITPQLFDDDTVIVVDA